MSGEMTVLFTRCLPEAVPNVIYTGKRETEKMMRYIMTTRHTLKTFRVKVKGEIYDRVYSIADLENLLDMFNDIHSQSMKVFIEEKEEGGDE